MNVKAADSSEWTQKGASLTDGTAREDYGVPRKFLIEGIRAGALEVREASIHGNPSLRILGRQLEDYIALRFGADYLASAKSNTEMRQVVREIGGLRRKLRALEARKAMLEAGSVK
jgi:hypothetical protein